NVKKKQRLSLTFTIDASIFIRQLSRVIDAYVSISLSINRQSAVIDCEADDYLRTILLYALPITLGVSGGV
ncbi:MAG TPA: hypothetical protein PLG34_11065, partial [Spirochaetota bacterium]|nr:hypothetical protein [Spirochaetota bacterium]HPY88509.1 hypothetical protein [Spirochaetota bacterium]